MTRLQTARSPQRCAPAQTIELNDETGLFRELEEPCRRMEFTLPWATNEGCMA